MPLVTTFVCRHCRCEKSANPRLKGKQSFCGEPPCQRARKAAWKRGKMEQDSDYRLNHIEGNRSWRKSHPDYWREYRRKNPEKEKRNRLLQKLRRIRARGDASSVIESPPSVAKVDALISKELQLDSLFWIKPAVAKVDAILVEISSLSTSSNELQRSTRSSPSGK